MRAFLADNPRTSTARHRYTFADTGLDLERVARAMRAATRSTSAWPRSPIWSEHTQPQSRISSIRIATQVRTPG